VRAATVAILVIVGSAGSHWLVRWASPRLFRRVDPATAGTLGFLIRLLAMAAVVVLALRIAGVTAATLAVGGAFTAIVLGLAAQQTLGSLFAGIVLQSTRPFRVGERVRLVGGALAGSLEGTVSSLGLFYTTLVQGADRLQVPNSVLVNLVVVPLREPPKVDLRARFSHEASPRRIEERLLAAIGVPTRYPPSVALEEVDENGVVLRVSATPLRSDDGSQLAEEVLEALRRGPEAQAAA
jgi:small-conductance mechanosensitive channel